MLVLFFICVIAVFICIGVVFLVFSFKSTNPAVETKSGKSETKESFKQDKAESDTTKNVSIKQTMSVKKSPIIAEKTKK